MALPAEKERYTFADVLTWPDNERAELIDGEPRPPRRTSLSALKSGGSSAITWKGKSAVLSRPHLPSGSLRKTATARKM